MRAERLFFYAEKRGETRIVRNIIQYYRMASWRKRIAGQTC